MTEISPLDLDVIVSEIGIDKSSVIELLKIYSTEVSDEMQKVKLYLGSKEWHSMQKAMHSIKGVSSNLYLQDMFDASETLDMKLKKQDYDNIEYLVQDLFDVFNVTNKKIQSIINHC